MRLLGSTYVSEIHNSLASAIPTLIRVVAAVVQRGDRYLVCLRPPEKRHGELWEFPGGKCEPLETDFAAISRELHEELAVTVTNVGSQIFAIHDHGSPFLIVFLPATIEGEPSAHEHTAVAWHTLNALSELPFAPSDDQFVAHMQAVQRLTIHPSPNIR